MRLSSAPNVSRGPAVQVRIIICLLFLTMIVVAVLFGHLGSGRACRDRHCFHMGPAISARRRATATRHPQPAKFEGHPQGLTLGGVWRTTLLSRTGLP